MVHSESGHPSSGGPALAMGQYVIGAEAETTAGTTTNPHPKTGACSAAGDAEGVVGEAARTDAGAASHPAHRDGRGLRSSVTSAAQRALLCYGTSTCGPRGFFGTMDAHLFLEAAISATTGHEAALVYALAATTSATVLPVFLKGGDLVVMPNTASPPLRDGLRLSRAGVIWYDPEDLDALERRLEQVMAADTRSAAAARRRWLSWRVGNVTPLDIAERQRRFLAIEGLSPLTGTFANLPRLKAIADRFRLRTMLDDSFAFGAVGATALGTPELYGLRGADFDIYVGSFSHAYGCFGAFAAACSDIIEHMRLTSAGYVYSCALPPLFAVTSRCVLAELANPMSGARAHLANLHRNIRVAHRAAADAGAVTAAVYNSSEGGAGASSGGRTDGGPFVFGGARGRPAVVIFGTADGEALSPVVLLRVCVGGRPTDDDGVYERAERLLLNDGYLVARRPSFSSKGAACAARAPAAPFPSALAADGSRVQAGSRGGRGARGAGGTEEKPKTQPAADAPALVLHMSGVHGERDTAEAVRRAVERLRECAP
eukprot:TRINITY_DN2575_c5_g1_i1.p1 TRINITY_DN2575_c5_g1~~TRINITY_DN2575_c5_g1_i1.p1  ORF type:complete len:544 (+),score=131.58 TRINITY_DN2575_c5_g1_i1:902-2533(+)